MPCPAVPAVQNPIDVVEALECDLLDLHRSTSHNVEACVTRRDTSSNVLAIGVAEEAGPPMSDCGRVAEVVKQCRGPQEITVAVSGSQATTVSASWRDALPQFESPTKSAARVAVESMVVDSSDHHRGFRRGQSQRRE